jgi:hypothetical protein
VVKSLQRVWFSLLSGEVTLKRTVSSGGFSCVSGGYQVLEEVVVAALPRDVQRQTAFDVADVDARALGHQLLDESGVAVVGCAVQRRGAVVVLRVELRAVAHQEVGCGLLVDLAGVDQRRLAQLVLGVGVQQLAEVDQRQDPVVLDRDVVDALAFGGSEAVVRAAAAQQLDGFLAEAGLRGCHCSWRTAAA